MVVWSIVVVFGRSQLECGGTLSSIVILVYVLARDRVRVVGVVEAVAVIFFITGVGVFCIRGEVGLKRRAVCKVAGLFVTQCCQHCLTGAVGRVEFPSRVFFIGYVFYEKVCWCSERGDLCAIF